MIPVRLLNESSSLLIALAEYSSREAAANPLACCLSGVRTQAYCLLAADSICRNLKDLLPRQHLLQQTQQPILQVQHLICRGISKQNKCKINVNKLTLDLF